MQIMAAENMRQKLQRVYPLEIVQTNSLGRLQKKSSGHNDCLYLEFYCNGESDNPQQKISLVRKITFKQIVEVLFQCIKTLEQRWSKQFERNLRTWKTFLHTGLTKLHVFFMNRSTAIFSSTVLVISSKEIASNKEALL